MKAWWREVIEEPVYHAFVRTARNSHMGMNFSSLCGRFWMSTVKRGKPNPDPPPKEKRCPKCDKPSDSDIWCYPPHTDAKWRLTDKATNNWMGTIETKEGDEVMDLTAKAAEDFVDTFRLAQRIVRRHNEELGIHLQDYDL
jgi:hypothetical protein